MADLDIKYPHAKCCVEKRRDVFHAQSKSGQKVGRTYNPCIGMRATFSTCIDNCNKNFHNAVIEADVRWRSIWIFIDIFQILILSIMAFSLRNTIEKPIVGSGTRLS